MKKVVIIGSGGLKIGQAGEFDYSGSQGIKALKEEGFFTVLINPNIATIQTDESGADRLYLLPLDFETVKKIVEKERPDHLLLSVGGQTALNLGLQLVEEGVIEAKAILGTSIESIRIAEDRGLFAKALEKISIPIPKSRTARDVEQAKEIGKELKYPLMIRAGFSLGGLGSGMVENEEALVKRAKEAFRHADLLLIEEYLLGFKELEVEVLRDRFGNSLVICIMENFDPMGIHTGESIVIAPAQTLSSREYHTMRRAALEIVEALDIVGECNVQFAMDPKNGSFRTIELNPRLSRSSALASKATGYPLAYISTKLQLGFALPDLVNSVTKRTSAFFEPALDYVVIKIPRWDTEKLKGSERTLGSEMKSVGEVMGIGRSFEEAIQKASRMLNIGQEGLFSTSIRFDDIKKALLCATDLRLFAISTFFEEGGEVEEAYQLTHIDRWFLEALHAMSKFIHSYDGSKEATKRAKKLGFSDRFLSKKLGMDEIAFRKQRKNWNIVPYVKQIDTLAGEFEAETNYLYLTYHGSEHDIRPLSEKPIAILGSGPYCIGSSVEFDWCSVNLSRELRRRGKKSLLINSNPETVSTDYDESDRLYFEELSLERILDICDFEEIEGLVVSVGGQIANNVALPLAENGIPILGTSAESIDMAENRRKFSALLEKLDIDQPTWTHVTNIEEAKAFSKKVGYPVLVRPSYVLSGAAMNIARSESNLEAFLERANSLAVNQATVISKFIENAKELELDGIACRGVVIFDAISEHVENAGVHSGDATLVLPPQKLYLETIRRAKKIARMLAKELEISGPFNIQFIATENLLKVIECNVRASRSLPFVAKVTKEPLMEKMVDALFKKGEVKPYETLEMGWVGVKSPLFSYHRMKGSDPVASVEMASTGEVACLGDDLFEAFLSSFLAAEQKITGKRILVSIGGEQKAKFLPLIQALEEKGYDFFATENTHAFLANAGIGSTFVYKASDEKEPSVLTVISKKKVDLIITIPRKESSRSFDGDGYKIRRLAIDCKIPIVTNAQLAHLLLLSLVEKDPTALPIKAWQEYI